MEPLNKKERIRFIVKFTAAFIAGILILLIPFYFILRLPVYEGEIRAEDCRNMQKIFTYQQEIIAARLDSANRLVLRYDIPNQDIDKLNADLGLLLSEMEQSFANDTAWTGRMYNNIVKAFIEVKKAKTEKIKCENELKETQQDLEKAKEEASKTKDTMGG